MPSTEIREAPAGRWIKPKGFDHSPIFVTLPYNAADESNPLIKMPEGTMLFREIPIPATIEVLPRDKMTPQQARALGRALIRAADDAEQLQREFDSCNKKPKQEISSSASPYPAARPRRSTATKP